MVHTSPFIFICANTYTVFQHIHAVIEYLTTYYAFAGAIKMIPLQQWRVAIGSFLQRFSCKNYDSGGEYNDHSHMISNNQCCNLLVGMGYCIMLYFIFLCLLVCGDIETNPGPGLYMVCPSCEGKVHVQKSVCSCGFVFKKKTRHGGYKKNSLGFATTTNRHSVAAVSKSSISTEKPEKCSVDTNFVCSESYVSTEHQVCDSQGYVDTVTKGDISSDTSGSTSSYTSNPIFENSQPHEHTVSQPIGTLSKWTSNSTFENSQLN